MPIITVNEDLTSHTVSDDGTQEFFLASHNPYTLVPFTSSEQVEAFIRQNLNANWWSPYVDPEVREQQRLEQEREGTKASRAIAYRNEADPLFFKYQRGEGTEQEWLDKIEEIRERFPYPAEA
jgi:hypothetical protein